MNMNDIQDMVVTVMGLGRLKKGSGVGAVKWLLRHGAQVVITDFRDEAELNESIDEVSRWFDEEKAKDSSRELYHPVFVLGEHREEDFTQAQMVVTNPDIPHDSPYLKLAKDAGVPVRSDVSLFFELCPYSVTGVTAARGKTFMTALAGEMCKAANPATVVAGNMRVSPLEYLDEIMVSKEPMPIVLELSSWLLESLDDGEKGPTVGLFTNIYADHLHRYNSLADYAASKKNIFAKGGANGVAVLSKDQLELAALASEAPGRVMWVSLSPLADGEEGVWVENGDVFANIGGATAPRSQPIMSASDVRMTGDDNLRNVLGAIVVAKLHGVSNERIQHVVSNFSTDDDRQEIVTDISGVLYVNDALGSTPELTLNVLRRFGERGRSIHLISGGDVTEGDLKELIKVVEMVCKSVILLPGEGSVKFENQIGTTEATQLLHAKTMEEAVKIAAETATSGDGVIFSPALGYKDPTVATKLGDTFAAAARGLK